VIVGWYGVAKGCFCAFVFMNGKYLSFTYPGASITLAEGINNAGEVVGEYTVGDNLMYHGFVTSPITADDFGEEGNAR
jgi:probable HAF family extracellular repeat protein